MRRVVIRMMMMMRGGKIIIENTSRRIRHGFTSSIVVLLCGYQQEGFELIRRARHFQPGGAYRRSPVLQQYLQYVQGVYLRFGIGTMQYIQQGLQDLSEGRFRRTYVLLQDGW